ncbi:MAG TPA: SDR family oxidoreductase [Steroidobacter sp.]|uniref:SDR family oxidoreductase n=1 Tax=Steroidobacter sp. TaxID=1978227 RepID=UPI002EDA1575
MSSQQRVIITAGAAGIGRGIADSFLNAGAAVCICDIDESALQRASRAEPRLVCVTADVSALEDAARVVREANERLGGVDVLVNNAGVAGPTAALEDISLEDWTRTFSVNVTGAFLMTRAVVRQMKSRRSGCIVNISTASTVTGLPRRAPYIASKFAIEGLTRNLARELGPFGIRVNAIRPGFMNTPRMQNIIQHYAAERGASVETVEREALGYISLRAKIEPCEVGDMAVYLCGHAARHITGQLIGVDGNAEWEG